MNVFIQDAFINIKYMIPAYESCVLNWLDSPLNNYIIYISLEYSLVLSCLASGL